ncbi:MAG: ATP-binding protein [Mogibacterium sp.]|nr:ATP-binding protein [Mogibacterium sp.]
MILFSLIGTTAGVGFQVTCIRCLSRGDTKTAGKALGEALILGTVLSVIVMFLTVTFTEPIVEFLHVPEDEEVFASGMDYLRGTALGLPAITAMSILTRGAHIEGKRNIVLISVAVMVVVNLLSDFIGINLFHVDVFGVTFNTSISYYAGTAVLAYYYYRGDPLVKPAFKGFTFGEMISVNRIGLAAGVIVVWYNLTLMAKAELINIGISTFSAESIGLLAYNVTVQINYFVNALMGSAVSAMFLLAGMYSAEQDKTNFKKVIKNVVIYEIISTAACSVLLWFLSGVVAKIYLGSASQAVIQGTASALKAYTAGLLFQMIVLVFANYIQCFSHNIIPVITFFISNVVLVLYGVAYGGTIVSFYGTNVAAGIFGGVSTGSIIAVLILPVFIAIINLRNGCRDHLWMFPKNFGVPAGDEISADLITNDEVMAFSEKAWQFCVDKGESNRIAYLTSLSVEEMAKNVIEHGFTKDEKDHLLSVRIVHKGDELIIRMRDNCRSFDPRKKYEQMYANPDDSDNIGIRMIMAEADEVSYTSMFNLNNLLIRIGKVTDKQRTSALAS